MICPKCHAEYLEDNEKCGDCNLKLIDACSIDIPIPDMQWVTLKPIYNSTTADMITEILNNISIRSDDLQNKIYFKNLLNLALINYAG